MATKEGLTRDEAREAIGILALKEDNLKNIVTSVMILLFAVVALFTSIIIALNRNLPYSFFLDFLYFIAMIVTLLILIFVLFSAINSKLKSIEETMKELAKRYNLEEFLNAVSGKK